ncbi:hypothetical protein GUJ93_ZPchr0013g37138 [Zizania palustris]|uniref:Uncharacterized protein n=1 Tax=Zizania palustris TaxID=103762 RepID=A0A8J5WZB0_ZIZPA|nr:hypothetical protein GUJ93_ZPchr0013g37138 [Zizania palustris]
MLAADAEMEAAVERFKLFIDAASQEDTFWGIGGNAGFVILHKRQIIRRHHDLEVHLLFLQCCSGPAQDTQYLRQRLATLQKTAAATELWAKSSIDNTIEAAFNRVLPVTAGEARTQMPPMADGESRAQPSPVTAEESLTRAGTRSSSSSPVRASGYGGAAVSTKRGPDIRRDAPVIVHPAILWRRHVDRSVAALAAAEEQSSSYSRSAPVDGLATVLQFFLPSAIQFQRHFASTDAVEFTRRSSAVTGQDSLSTVPLGFRRR